VIELMITGQEKEIFHRRKLRENAKNES
jgi:hypothetical protein